VTQRATANDDVQIKNNLVAVPSTQLVAPVRDLKGDHSKKFLGKGSTCNVVKYSFYYRTIREWNQLSEDAVSATTLEAFKKNIRM